MECALCGGPIIQPALGRRRDYCSDRCRWRVGDVARKARRRGRAHVRQACPTYVVEIVPEGPLKIGRAKNPRERLEAIRTACPYPVRLLGTVNVPERLCHEDLRNLRLRGEWYKREALSYLVANGLVAPLP